MLKEFIFWKNIPLIFIERLLSVFLKLFNFLNSFSILFEYIERISYKASFSFFKIKGQLLSSSKVILKKDSNVLLFFLMLFFFFYLFF